MGITKTIKRSKRIFFHGSAYLSDMLLPGVIANGGQRKEFVDGLTNEWFYVSTNKPVAIQHAICALATLNFQVSQTKLEGELLVIDVKELPTMDDVQAFYGSSFYVYAIHEGTGINNWSKVPNTSSSYYTDECITGLYSVEVFTVRKILEMTGCTIMILPPMAPEVKEIFAKRGEVC